MSVDPGVAAIGRMQAAMDRINELTARVVVANGPTDPENLAILARLKEANAEFRAAKEELKQLGYDL